MSYRFQREWFGPSELSLTASAATSARLQYKTAAGGVLFVSAVGGGAATITWWACSDPSSAAVQLLDASGNAITTAITAGTVRLIPDSLYGCHTLVPVVNAGTATVTYTGKS